MSFVTVSHMTQTSIEAIFKYAHEKNASDIHLLVGKPPITRIDGVLHELTEKFDEVSHKTMEGLVFSLLTAEQKEKFLREKELDLSFEIAKTARYRVNCHFERGHIGLVARIINYTVPSMEEIMMPEIVYQMSRLYQGLILTTGPTGSGKSTSQAAMINLINSERRVHIVTLEDPVEYIHESKKSIIRQRQLGTDFKTFKEALKHIVRQDPNVILVGEMRDLETIGAAMTLAETGHLVLATLHTINAAQTVDRIIDVFPPYQQTQIRLQLSLALRGVISHQLLPKEGGGRIAAREIMVNTPAVGNLIRENKIAQIKSVIQTSAEEGMTTMDQNINQLFKQRLISEEVARSYLVDQHSLG